MPGKVTLSLDTNELHDRIKSNPEVELQIAKGVVANVTDRLSEKAMEDLQEALEEIKKNVGLQIEKVIDSKFFNIQGSFCNAKIVVKKGQRNALNNEVSSRVREIAKEMVTEENIKAVIERRINEQADQYILRVVQRHLHNYVRPTVDAYLNEALKKKLGITG